MLRLMIADDEAIIRNALASLIDYESIGYELIATAKNGMEAYDIICDEELDVVITDIRMPGLNGLELIERAKKIDSKLEFVILSGYGEFEYAKQAMKFGVKEYILKPTNKRQVMEALEDIKVKKEKERQSYLEERQKLLKTMKYPIQRAFVIESLQAVRFGEVFHKYQSILSLNNRESNIIFCYFVEQKDRIPFVKRMGKILERYEVQMIFPIFAVTGSLVFVTASFGIGVQEKIKEATEDWSFGMGREIVTEFTKGETLEKQLEKVFQKISRYKEINLVDIQGNSYKIQNTVNSPQQMERIQELVKKGENISQVTESIFMKNKLELNELRNIAFDIYMGLKCVDDAVSVEISCEILRKLYACDDVKDICEVMNVALRNESGLHEKKSNIVLLKEYVQSHLDAENLSLKWIAENYLFTNVQYLSKQFVREEGERFSDYLTRQRMEEAKRLLKLYSKDSVKDIARTVGFGNNPRYFSQVFKKYVGCAPSEYADK